MGLNEIYTAALMEHNAHPDYKYEMEDATHSHEGVNPSCGDDIILQLRMDGDTIDEASFTGSGCAVSLASADIMAELVTEEDKDEALRLCELFLAMIRGEVTDDAELEDLGDAAELKSIARMPARVKCAELAWRTLMTILTEQLEGDGEQA